MATGLDPRGRGVRHELRLAMVHTLAAAAGGAALGAALGGVGLLLRLDEIRPWFIACGAAGATYLSWSRRHGRLGRQKQVRRRWPRGTPRWLAFVAWGLNLGFGVLTSIPYASWLFVLVAEAAAGPFLAAIAGAFLGAARESLLLVAAFRSRDPSWLMNLLPPRLDRSARIGDVALIMAGGALLALGGLA